MHECAARLSVLMEELESWVANNPSNREFGYVLEILRAQILAAEGEIKEASRILDKLIDDDGLNSRDNYLRQTCEELSLLLIVTPLQFLQEVDWAS